MSGILSQLGDAIAIIRSVVERVPQDQWDNPTCCEEWSARQVAEHVAWRLDRLLRFADETASAPAGSSAADTTTLDLGDDIAAEFESIAIAAMEQLSEPGALDHISETRYGDISLANVVRHTWTEPLIHAWDIATATGVAHRIGHEIATAAYTTLFPLVEGVRLTGRYGPAFEPGPNADMIDVLVALAGRDPGHDPSTGKRRPAPKDLHLTERLFPIEDNLERMVEAVERLTKVADQVPPDAWENDTACTEWNASQVAFHCAWRAERLGNFATGDDPVPTEADLAPFQADPATELRSRLQDVLERIRQPGAADRQVETPVGTMTVGDVFSLVMIELTIHTWDIADATNVDHEIDDVTAALVFSQLHQIIDSIGDMGYYNERVEPNERTIVNTMIAITGRVSVRDEPRSRSHL